MNRKPSILPKIKFLLGKNYLRIQIIILIVQILKIIVNEEQEITTQKYHEIKFDGPTFNALVLLLDYQYGTVAQLFPDDSSVTYVERTQSNQKEAQQSKAKQSKAKQSKAKQSNLLGKKEKEKKEKKKDDEESIEENSVLFPYTLFPL